MASETLAKNGSTTSSHNRLSLGKATCRTGSAAMGRRFECMHTADGDWQPLQFSRRHGNLVINRRAGMGARELCASRTKNTQHVIVTMWTLMDACTGDEREIPPHGQCEQTNAPGFAMETRMPPAVLSSPTFSASSAAPLSSSSRSNLMFHATTGRTGAGHVWANQTSLGQRQQPLSGVV